MARRLSWLCAVGVLLALAPSAHATFPGANGRLAYEGRDPSGIWTMRPDGEFRTRLLANSGVSSTAWSPDGRELAFTSVGDVYRVGADGRGLRRLTRTSAYESEPSWSPDGARIAYVRSPAYNRYSLWTMTADGRDRRRAIDEVGWGDAEWSPDGRWFAYHWPEGGLGVLDLRTGEARRISPVERGGVRGLSWSPDSSWIVFEQDAPHVDFICDTCPPGFNLLGRIRPDGSGYRDLQPPDDPDYDTPVWSPNGRAIQYCRWTFDGYRPGERSTYDRWSMKPDGSGRRRVSASGCRASSWQPLPR